MGRIRVTLGLDSRGQPHAYPRSDEVRVGHLGMQGKEQPSTIIGSIMSIMASHKMCNFTNLIDLECFPLGLLGLEIIPPIVGQHVRTSTAMSIVVIRR